MENEEPKVNQESQPSQEQVELAQQVMEDVGVQSEFTSVIDDASSAKTATKAERNNIEDILRKADDMVEAKRLEAFLEQLNAKLAEQGIDKKITSYDEMTVEQRNEFRDFKLPDDEMNKLYEESKKEIMDLTTSRNNELDSLGNRMDALYENIGKEISQREAAKEGASPEQVKKLDEEINRLKDMQDKLGPRGGKSEIRRDLANAFTNHDEARMNAVKGLSLVYSEERVRGDHDIAEKLVPENMREEYMKQQGEQQRGDKPNAEQPKQQNEKQDKTKGDASQPQAKATTGNTLEDMVEETRNSLPPIYKIGYNEKNAMNFANATELLGSFANNYNLNDQERLEMLNDPESKKILLNALRIAGNNISPSKAKSFDLVREKIINLSNGPLMERALADIGITDVNNVKKEFKQANKEYTNKRKEITNMLNSGHISAEAKENLEQELAALDEKYTSIRNVAEFNKSVGHIKTIKSRLKGFKDALLNKNTYKQLGEGVVDKAKAGWKWLNTEPEVEDNQINYDAKTREERYAGVREEKTPEPTVDAPETDFASSLKSSTYDQKEQAENTQKREEKEQSEQTMSRTQKNQKLYEDIKKDNIDGPSI